MLVDFLSGEGLGLIDEACSVAPHMAGMEERVLWLLHTVLTSITGLLTHSLDHLSRAPPPWGLNIWILGNTSSQTSSDCG